MIPALKPANEIDRLAALRRYMVLDSEREAAFDRVTALAARLLDVPMALVTLVDADRQWFKSTYGIERGETKRDEAFCAHTILTDEPMMITDAHEDERFVDNPFVTGDPHVRFYAGSPLQTPDGYNLGALCAIDTRPRTLSADQLSLLDDLSAVVADLLEARLSARARQMFEKVTELSPDVIYVFDLEKRMNVYGNREVSSVLGFDVEKIGPRMLETLFHPEDLPHVVSHLSQFATLPDGENVELTYRVRDALGTYRWFRANETVFTRDAGGRATQTLGVAVDITQLKETEQQLAERAVTDELTKLPNTRAVRERLNQLAHEGNRGRKFAVVVADIDHFKRVNDGYGHKVGDEVIAAVGRALRDNVRVTDFVGRYGGEEFVILYTDVDEARAGELAEKLQLAVAAIEKPLRVTCSFGVCGNAGDLAKDAEGLFKAADAALYRAKKNGRDRVVCFHSAEQSNA